MTCPIYRVVVEVSVSSEGALGPPGPALLKAHIGSGIHGGNCSKDSEVKGGPMSLEQGDTAHDLQSGGG